MEWKKLIGAETGPMFDQETDWDAAGIDFYEDVEYGTGGGHALYLDLMLPRSEGKKPVIIWIHGGGWSALSKKWRPTNAIRDACRMGFAVASVEYRLVPEAPFPAPIEDCKCAVRFLKAHADELGLNPDRIGVWGESAGGHLSALVGAAWNNPRLEGCGGWSEYSSRVQAVCDWYCGGDMTHMGAWKVPEVQQRAAALGVKLTRMGEASDAAQSGLYSQICGRPCEEVPQLAMDISPIFYVDQPQPAYLLMHGECDDTVPPAFSYHYFDALVSHGHDATFVLVPNQGHGFFKGKGYYDIVLGFFRQKLMDQ